MLILDWLAGAPSELLRSSRGKCAKRREGKEARLRVAGIEALEERMLLTAVSNGTVASFVAIPSPAPTVFPQPGDQFGFSVTSIGDLNNDGVADLAVGAPQDSTVGYNRGAVYIEFLNADGTVKSTTQIASGTNGGPAIRDSSEFGSSVTAIGDINGDGIVDLAVGAPRESVGAFTRGQEVGAVYVLLLNRDGTVKSSTRISGTNGGPHLPSFGEFGFSVSNVGDLNGDGIDEVAVGSARGKNVKAARGQVSILFLNSDGTVKSSTKIASKVGGGPKLADNDVFGTSVSGIGDLNGDGIKDLAVGAEGDDTNGNSRGAVYILFLNEKGKVKSFTKI
ncbi:MAG: protein containing repeat, partial [Planctomycetaceae bacterium]|nr:protein containing repeat [Planctomycetaceae bacterium]